MANRCDDEDNGAACVVQKSSIGDLANCAGVLKQDDSGTLHDVKTIGTLGQC